MTLFEPIGLLPSFASTSSSTLVSNGLLPGIAGSTGILGPSLSNRHTSNYVSARDFGGRPIIVPRKKKAPQAASTTRSSRDLEGLLEVPTHRMLEKMSLDAITAGSRVRDATSGDVAAGGVSVGCSMWVDQYKPKMFTDLLGDEGSEYTGKLCLGSKNGTSAFSAGENVDLRNKQRQIFLFMTSLTLWISDARTGSIVDERIRPVLESGTAMGTNKPVLMVIDEIDGATGDNAGGFVNKLIQLTLDKPKPKKGRGDKSRNEARPLLRPIICICNDLYAPSLARLRPVARIIRFRKVQPVLLANRLRDICQNEDLRADTRALTTLVTVSQGDMRACLNTLQFIKTRTTTVTEHEIARCTVGMKETECSIQSAWQDLFTPLTAKTRKLVPGSSATDPDWYVSRLSRVIENAGPDKVAIACFEHYTTLRKGRSEWTSLLAAHEWFEWYDLLSMKMRTEQEYALMPYQPYALVAFHPLFAALGNPKYERVNTDWEQFTRTKLNDDIKTTVCNGLTTGVRDADAASYLHLMCGHKAALEFLPLINRILCPPLKPLTHLKQLNSQIVRTQERLVLKRLVDIMAAMEVRYVQERNEEGQFVYRLDPAIDVFVTYDGKRADDMNISRFAVRQMIAEELDAACERRKHEATAKPGQLDLGSGRKPRSVDTPTEKVGQSGIAKSVKPLIGEKRPVDFFGRPIVPKEKNAQSGVRRTSSTIVPVPLPIGCKIKYKFNEGNSSAVRKPVKMASLL
ncbi:hypothetical protein FRC10_002353 [Ceratobasidium sp. 414]|nr:hypothetical protein FRC10_002353 [Ceratobasidium sp. 414]